MALTQVQGELLTNPVNLYNPSVVSGSILNSNGRPMVNQTGSVLQVVQGTLPTSSGFSTTSTSDTFTGLTASITPSSTNSKILILLSPAIRATGGQGYVYQKLWRGSVGSGTLIEDGYPIIGGTTTNNDIRAVGAFNYLDSPATTSTVTYNVSLNATYTTTVWMSSTTSPSTLILMEIAG